MPAEGEKAGHLSTIDAAWERFLADRNDADRTFLIEAGTPLARVTAEKMLLPGEDLDDLAGIAVIGLTRAVDRYRPGRGMKREVFLIWTITNAIKDARKAGSWASREAINRRRDHEAEGEGVGRRVSGVGVRGRKAKEGPADPRAVRQGKATDACRAAAAGLTLDQWYARDAATALPRQVSLEAMTAATGETLADPCADPAAQLVGSADWDQALRWLDDLQGHEAAVIRGLYLEKQTPRKLAKALGLAVDEVIAIKKRVTCRWRQRVARDRIKCHPKRPLQRGRPAGRRFTRKRVLWLDPETDDLLQHLAGPTGCVQDLIRTALHRTWSAGQPAAEKPTGGEGAVAA